MFMRRRRHSALRAFSASRVQGWLGPQQISRMAWHLRNASWACNGAIGRRCTGWRAATPVGLHVSSSVCRPLPIESCSGSCASSADTVLPVPSGSSTARGRRRSSGLCQSSGHRARRWSDGEAGRRYLEDLLADVEGGVCVVDAAVAVEQRRQCVEHEDVEGIQHHCRLLVSCGMPVQGTRAHLRTS